MEMLKQPLMRSLEENKRALRELGGDGLRHGKQEPEGRSRYVPHQGSREAERRRKRLAKAETP